MRVAIDVHAIGMRQTGNETYIRNLTGNLEQLGLNDLEFHYYHTLPPGAVDTGLGSAQLHRLRPHTPFLRIPLSFPAALWAHKIDLAHFQYVAPPLCPCRTIVTIHDISFEFFPEYFNPLQRARMRMLIPPSGKRANHVITISEFSRRQLIETYCLKEEKVSVTYLGVADTFRCMRLDEADAALTRFGLAMPYILGVGNVQPRKNLTRLIRAFAYARRKRNIPHQLVLVGQMAWKGREIMAEIERLGIADAVKITGYVSDEELVALYNRADVFVYPSLYEGFGLPILEAMACGAPVVTSHAASMPEVAGDAALLVDPLSESDIATAILRLIDGPQLSATLRRKGLQQSGRFRWKAVAEQTANIYRKFG